MSAAVASSIFSEHKSRSRNTEQVDLPLRQIEHALKKGNRFELRVDASKKFSIHLLSYMALWKERQDPLLCKTREGIVANVFADYLETLPRQEPCRALKHEAFRIVRLFLKVGLTSPTQQLDHVNRCTREFLAFKLGISSDLFDLPCNKGFEGFAAKQRLERYLAEYREGVVVSPQGEICLLQRGKNGVKSVPWKTLQKEIPQQPPPPPLQLWFYGPQGFQVKNMFQWKELTPYKKEDPAAWGRRYLFELCCCTPDDYPQFTEDHSWIQLKTPTGDVYSVGLYRPYKTNAAKQNFQSPLRTQKGTLMSPELSLFWGLTVQSIQVAITPQQFLIVKEKIERDKAEEGSRCFHTLYPNCTDYVLEVGRVVGIEVPVSRSMWALFAKRYIPAPITQSLDLVTRPIGFIPALLALPVKKVTAAGVALLSNLVLKAAGAGLIDPEVATLAKPHLASNWDLLKPEKFYVKHPHTLGHETRQFVRAWRKERGAFVQETRARIVRQVGASSRQVQVLDQALKQLRFKLPPKGYHHGPF